ncbi:MAG: alpha/beta hydrolase [Myxococcales bacterium]|nr:alpha/beta hydrolase [Myxococcales bacterium]
MRPVRELRVAAQDGTDLCAYDTGGGDGPTLLLCNGLGGNLDAWQYFVDEFGGRHRIVSWDYRGLYKSGAPQGNDYTVSTQCEDGRAVLDALGVKQAIFVGWSMGVQVSFELYRHHRERALGLILINGTYGRPLATAFAPVLRGSPIVPLLPAVTRALEAVAHLSAPVQPLAQKIAQTRISLKVLKLLGLVSASLDERVFLELAGNVAALDMPRYMATLNSLADHCAEAMLPRIDVPVLIVTGDRDLFTPVEQSRNMAMRIPGAELLVIPSGTHYTPLEFPELIHLRVRKFVKERLGHG